MVNFENTFSAMAATGHANSEVDHLREKLRNIRNKIASNGGVNNPENAAMVSNSARIQELINSEMN